ncbi:hypothetical protein BH10CYA1_BH10CYA1_18060 [soil metagenome]
MNAVHSDHFGSKPVAIGSYQIWPGGAVYFMPGDFDGGANFVLIPLAEEEGIPPYVMRMAEYSVLACPMTDFGGVPDNWENFLRSQVIPKLAAGQHLIPFCKGGHGRTGTLIASLIAILEPSVTDPIAAVRERYCSFAVETIEQGTAIFALAGQPLPMKYQSGPGQLAVKKQLPSTQYKKKKK